MEKQKTDSKKAKEFNKVFWAHYNKKCLSCINTCKQSSMVEILFCKKFKKVSS